MTAEDTEHLSQLAATCYADEGTDEPRLYVFTNKDIPTIRAGEIIKVHLQRVHRYSSDLPVFDLAGVIGFVE
jgi:hypothetical protein